MSNFLYEAAFHRATYFSIFEYNNEDGKSYIHVSCQNVFKKIDTLPSITSKNCKKKIKGCEEKYVISSK